MLLTNGELIMALSGELFRQGHVPAVTGRPMPERMTPSLPSAKCPDYRLLDMPDRIPKLSIAIEQANNLARTTMEAKANAA
jgi:hypothetical protein